MIKLRSPLELKVLTGHRWELFFDTGELFSLTTPFRDYLELIRQELSKNAPAALSLPSTEGDDDCVSGEIVWQGVPIAVYFERPLSYFTLTGADEAVMRQALDAIRPLSQVA